jgi:CubicO group peptidase (beta-lactamase class C family)
MKKTGLLIALTIILAACTQQGKGPGSFAMPEVDPAGVGVSPKRLAEIDSMCVRAIREREVPGIVALIARNGKIVYYKAFGMADNQAGRALKREDVFRIASQSKAIASTAAMILWEEGKFNLDDPVSKYIPEFANEQVLSEFNPADTTYTTVPARRPVTIRHLLTHTSGLGYGMIDGDERFRMIYQKAGIVDLFTTEDVKIGDNVKKLAKLPLHHDPGTAFVYSEGLDVMGYLVEIWSGMPFDRFLRERLFDPLDMNETWFYLPEELYPRLVTVQMPDSGQWVPFPVTFYDPDYPIKGAKTFFSGGAGLSSTAEDYATFLQMYLNDGEFNGVRILEPATIDTIMKNQFRNVWDSTDTYYGLVYGVLTQKGVESGIPGSAGTFNWGGYFNTQYFADPNQQITGIIMKQTQGTRTDHTGDNFRRLVFKSIEE